MRVTIHTNAHRYFSLGFSVGMTGFERTGLTFGLALWLLKIDWPKPLPPDEGAPDDMHYVESQWERQEEEVEPHRNAAEARIEELAASSKCSRKEALELAIEELSGIVAMRPDRDLDWANRVVRIYRPVSDRAPEAVRNPEVARDLFWGATQELRAMRRMLAEIEAEGKGGQP